MIKKAVFFCVITAAVFLTGCVESAGREWLVVKDEVVQVPAGAIWSYGNSDPNLTGEGELKWEVSSDVPLSIEIVHSYGDYVNLGAAVAYNSYPTLASDSVTQYEREATVLWTSHIVLRNEGAQDATVTFKHWLRY